MSVKKPLAKDHLNYTTPSKLRPPCTARHQFIFSRTRYLTIIKTAVKRSRDKSKTKKKIKYTK